MKNILLATSLTLFALAGTPALAQPDIRQEKGQSQKGQSSAPVKGGAPVSGRYDATGKIKCSVGNPTLDEWCDFRVVRHQPTGGAQIWISTAARPPIACCISPARNSPATKARRFRRSARATTGASMPAARSTT